MPRLHLSFPALVALLWLPPVAMADAALLDDCNAEAHARLLVPADASARAGAIWLDGQRLRWPGALEAASYALLHHPESLQANEGEAQRIELQPARAPLDPVRAARFAWIGEGPEFALPEGVDARDLLRGDLQLIAECEEGERMASTRLQHAAALDALYPAALAAPMGARPQADGIDFSLWAPTAQAVAVCLYPDDAQPAQAAIPLDRDDTTGAWSGRAEGGPYFAYLVDVFVPGEGLVRNRVTDPWSLGLGADGRRSLAIDLDDPATQPPGWATHRRPSAPESMVDMVLYELHVRDFSREDETVPAADRGRYRGFTHADSRGIRHLAALQRAGLTDVHLLPVYDIATIPEQGCVEPVLEGPRDGEQQQAALAPIRGQDCFNWGYDPQHYTVPEGSYASDAADGLVRIREFRQMVMALHGIGLRVGLDVVYNHTSHAGQHPQSVLDRIVPGYYHRLDAMGAIERSTCCENTATEHAMMARLMIDSAVDWVRHYAIDGFRFDLMGHQPRAAMQQLQTAVDAAAGRRIPLIGEGWNFGEVADGARFVQASQLNLAGSGIATFSDRARDAIRGGGAGDSGEAVRTRQGFVNGLGLAPNRHTAGQDAGDDLRRARDLVRVGLAGSLRGFALEVGEAAARPLREIDYGGQPAGYVASPEEVVNYVENHDNHTLYDINVLRLPEDTPMEERVRAQMLAVALNLFSQGIPYFHAGVEVLRSKSLDRNSYDSGDHFNRLDYSGADNGFGRGLPPAWDNAADWPWLLPLLARPELKPAPEWVDYSRRAFEDLLRVRAQTPLLRLRSAAEIERRLLLPLAEAPGLVLGLIDGRDHSESPHAAVLYAVNVALQPVEVEVAEARGRDFRLHPALAAADAADVRAREAVFDAESGRLSLPARTAVLFVLDP